MKKAKIYYFTLTDEQRKEEKLDWFRNTKFDKIPFELITPSKKNNWINLTDNDFEELMPLIDKKNQNTIFEFSSLGVSTNRDEWVYDFDENNLENKIKFFIEKYNEFLSKNDNSWNDLIKWSRDLKKKFNRKKDITFDDNLIMDFSYRPFTKKKWYAEKILNDVFTQNHFEIFGNKLNKKNQLISIYSLSSSHLLSCLATNINFDLAFLKQGNGGVFCLPLYRYTSEGKRVDNITQWALNEFRGNYNDKKITREDIFHYVYGVLHHPAYRKKYELNLKREFPRIPFYDDFWFWSNKGKELMDLHLKYEKSEKWDVMREERIYFKNKWITNQENNAIIQGTKSLAGSHELSNRHLQDDKTISEGRNLRTNESNEKSSRFDSIEHSRGSSTPHDGSISSIPVDSEGFVGGTGNTNNDSSSFGVHQSSSSNSTIKTSSESGKSDGRTDKGIESEGEISNSSRPSSHVPRPKLKADKEKGEIVLDEQTTLKNIPAVAWEYKLGNRSALEWILDQYKEKKPKDDTIREKFNTYKFEDYKEQVIELLQRVCTVSVKTMEIIEQMNKL